MTVSPGMSSVTPKSFLGLLDQSGLVDREVLRGSLAELSHKAAGRTLTVEDLSSHLVESGLITTWHAGKLKAGKYKGFFLGKYKLLGLLGSGGMSTVYLAQHTIFEQRRAIKVLPRNRLSSKTYLERFYREGRAAASLNHRNIVRVYDIGQEGDNHYLVMEFVEGQDLYSRVKQHGPLSFVDAVDFTIQALTGLAHAHENELVHRDVKPANLLVTPDGTVKVLDLGLALLREEDSSLTVVHNEKVLGTADYLSPEQAVDSHNVDRRADIYSSGCTLYYMITGRPPFPEGTLAQRIARHQSVAPDAVSKLRPDAPKELVAIVEKMMEKKPENRYQDCKSAIEALRALLESLPDTGSSPRKSLTTQTKAIKSPSSSGSGPLPKAVEKKNDESTSAKPAKPVSGAVTPSPSPVIRPAREGAVASAKPVAEPDLKKPAERTSPQERTPERKEPAKPVKDSPAPARPVSAKGTSEKAVEATPPAQKPPAPKPEQGDAKQKHSAGKPSTVLVSEKIDIVAPKAAAKTEVNPGENELKSFVATARKTQRNTAKPVRPSTRNQLVLLGIVAGMLLLLGLTVLIAMWLTSSGSGEEEEKKTSAPRSGEVFLASQPDSIVSVTIRRVDSESFPAI